MFRRRKLIDPAEVERERLEAAEAAQRARREREKVQRDTSAIMGEVREHARLLRENNFVGRVRRALGGAEV